MRPSLNCFDLAYPRLSVSNFSPCGPILRRSRNYVLYVSLAQRFVESINILANYVIETFTHVCQLLLQLHTDLTLLCGWRKVCTARNATGEIAELADQLWRPANAVLSLRSQPSLDQTIFDIDQLLVEVVRRRLYCSIALKQRFDRVELAANYLDLVDHVRS